MGVGVWVCVCVREREREGRICAKITLEKGRNDLWDYLPHSPKPKFVLH